jgi:hypothetical protein
MHWQFLVAWRNFMISLKLSLALHTLLQIYFIEVSVI